MTALAWIAAIWLTGLALFVTLMARRVKVQHPHPPLEAGTWPRRDAA